MKKKMAVLLICCLSALLLTMTAYAQGDPTGGGDADGDGIADSLDACPTLVGPATNNGCPLFTVATAVPPNPEQPPTAPIDSDGDGINDDQDACPTQPGDTANNGCPAAEQPTAPQITLVPMPTEGDCVMSTAGVDRVLIRDLPSVDSDVVGVIEPNVFIPFMGYVTTGDPNIPFWLLTDQGNTSDDNWIAGTVMRFGGDCPSILLMDGVDVTGAPLGDIEPDYGIVELETFDPPFEIDDILFCDFNDPVDGPECFPQGEPLMLNDELDILWCPEDDETEDCIVISQFGSPVNPIPPYLTDILCPEDVPGCIILDVPMIGTFEPDDILFCDFNDAVDGPECMPPSTELPNMAELDILWCPEDDSEDCIVITKSEPSPIPPYLTDILCPEDVPGCIELDIPVANATAETPNDYLWCDFSVDDVFCVGSLLEGQLSVAVQDLVVCTPFVGDGVCAYLPNTPDEPIDPIEPLIYLEICNQAGQCWEVKISEDDLICTETIDDAGMTIVECEPIYYDELVALGYDVTVVYAYPVAEPERE